MKTLKERFDEKWEPVTESGCWIWTGNILSDGYGGIWLDGLMRRAHRIAYELYKGKPIRFICHKCDMPLCVNPDHLFDGSHNDNMMDMRRKGRGDFNRIKLTKSQIMEIRNSDENWNILAEKYRVHKTHVWRIRSGKTWKHLK